MNLKNLFKTKNKTLTMSVYNKRQPLVMLTFDFNKKFFEQMEKEKGFNSFKESTWKRFKNLQQEASSNDLNIIFWETRNVMDTNHFTEEAIKGITNNYFYAK